MSAVVGQEDAFAVPPAATTATAAVARPRPALLPAAQWPLTLVIALISAGLAVSVLDTFRVGALVLAAAVGTGFVLRMILPQRTAGWLASRRRFVDLIVLGSLAGALAMVALSVPA